MDGSSPAARANDTVAHWIDGKATLAGDRTLPIRDPASGDVVRHVRLADAALVDRAVEAAGVASATWGTTPLGRRSDVLFAFRQLLVDNGDQLARIVTEEHGKTHDDARGEVARAIENVEYACGIGEVLKGFHTAQAATGVDVVTIRQPLGVVAGITPFNFPVMVPLWMASNAIACGNSFVLKPSEKDPSPSLLIAELLARAGLPHGVFSVVHGDRVVVDHLIEHPAVAALSFVGSTPVARHVHTAGSAAGKRVQALGGAKNHMVVLPDADIDAAAAADAAVSAGFGSAGERCMAISVVVAVGGIGDALVDAIAARIARIRIGAGADPDVDMGPLISAEHLTRVRSFLEPAAIGEATLVVDGRSTDVPDSGYFLGCSLLDGVRPGTPVYDEEVFGPVLSVVRADTYEDALTLVNDNPYGNGAAIFTRDGGCARHFQAHVEAGMVGINVPIPVPVSYHSFGGWGASLFGDTNMYGPDGMRFFTRAKVTTARWANTERSGVDFSFPGGRDS